MVVGESEVSRFTRSAACDFVRYGAAPQYISGEILQRRCVEVQVRIGVIAEHGPAIHPFAQKRGSRFDFAIAVDAGSKLSWQLVGEALDESTVRVFGAALIAVGG